MGHGDRMVCKNCILLEEFRRNLIQKLEKLKSECTQHQTSCINCLSKAVEIIKGK